MDKEIESFYPANTEEWRDWLAENHLVKDAVWLIFYKRKSSIPSISWSEAVDQALCFGWIDSKKKSIDERSYMQYFSKRKAQSTWSRINKDKVERLIEAGLMREAGLKCIKIAKQNGSWTFLDEIEALIIPDELEAAFRENKRSKAYFETLSKSTKMGLLYWVKSAKREETRKKRAHTIAEMAAQSTVPSQFR